MTVFTSLVLGLTCLLGIRQVTALANVGCLFDHRLCLEEELCYNDKIFGQCQVRGSSPVPESSTPLQSTSRPLLERELRRLLAGGYRWSHRYTQCVVQNIIHTERNKLKYDPGLCSRLLQLTLPEVAKEIVRDLQGMGPEEQALIRFRPSLLVDHPEFADELFTPLGQDPEEAVKDELEEGAFQLGQLLAKRSRHGPKELDSGQDEVSEEEMPELEEFRAWLEPLRDAWEQISAQTSTSDRLPDSEIPIVRTDLTSDLSRRPAYTEGGIQWLPVPADQATEEILSQTPLPTQDKQLAPPTDSVENPKVREREPDFTPRHLDGVTSKQAAEAFWRDVNDANTDKDLDSPPAESSFSSMSPAREPVMVAEKDLVQALPEMEDLWRPMVEEEEDDDGEEEDSVPPDMIAFSRPMRYDIKKPGPGYYVHEPEDDTPQAQEKQMLALLRSAQREQEARKWESFPKTPPDGSVGSASSRAPTADEVNDEEATLQELVRQSMGSSASKSRVPHQKSGKSSIQEDKRERAPSSARSGPVAAPLSQAETMPHPLKEQLELVDTSQVYMLLQETDPAPEAGERLVRRLERLLSLPRGVFSNIRTENDRVTFKVNPNAQHLNATMVARQAEMLVEDLKRSEGLTVLAAGIGDKGQLEVIRQASDDRRLFILTFILCGSVVGILLAVSVVYLVRRHARSRQKLQNLAQPDSEPSQDYQDLCRQRMQRKSSEKPEPVHRSSLPGSGPPQHPKRVSSLSQSENSQASPSSRSSTSSWSEEPVTSNMDVSTGHLILSYMEDHLKNRDRLEREWEALCAYEAEPCGTVAATLPHNVNKNRYPDVLPYDHSRVVLNDLTNVSTSDYINASTITDHDPRNPAYIATQGPLPHTAADFWQMIWEQGSVVAVTLTRLMENGVALCHRYWPEEGSEVYHIYEVHLVSEHIWCDDYLVRSFYLKNLKTSETRTVTQFHFLSWPENGVPASTKALLEFRRKVNKSYRGRSCPIVVHCSDGSGRTGTYCLIDMVLNRMAKGAKEIDIAATLEHIRDQRTGMVKTQAQFEFVLMAIAEEVHAILKALSN